MNLKGADEAPVSSKNKHVDRQTGRRIGDEPPDAPPPPEEEARALVLPEGVSGDQLLGPMEGEESPREDEFTPGEERSYHRSSQSRKPTDCYLQSPLRVARRYHTGTPTSPHRPPAQCSQPLSLIPGSATSTCRQCHAVLTPNCRPRLLNLLRQC
eukprot:s3291_g1.t1